MKQALAHAVQTGGVRPRSGLTPAEARVIEAATWLVDANSAAFPRLTEAVNALHRDREALVSDEAFHACLLQLGRTSRAADVLRRSQHTAHELLFELSALDVMDVRNAGWHCWAIWYLACEEFDVEPPWAAEMLLDARFVEQVDHERHQIRQAKAGGPGMPAGRTEVLGSRASAVTSGKGGGLTSLVARSVVV